MSETESFIQEVTEEVRRDRLFAIYRRYGWIAALVILLIVGGAAFNEYRKAQATASAQELGDSIVAALGENETEARLAKLSDVSAKTATGNAILDLLRASGEVATENPETAIEALTRITTNAEVPEIYRQIASFKMLTLQADTMAADELRLGFEALAQPGAPLRLLAEEQLALIDMAGGDKDAAIARFQAILVDAEVSAGLQQRATRAIVALGGTPEILNTQQG